MNHLSHHAYLVEGPLSLLPQLDNSARKLFDFPAEHALNVLVWNFEKLGVDEAAQVRQQATFKSTEGRSLFIVAFSTIMSEAQQSLLKLLEEPQEGTTLILLAPHGSLLPTIHSRLLPYPEQQIALQNGLAVRGTETRGPFVGQFVAKFIAASGKDRSTQIAALLKDEEGERERVRTFLNELESTLYAALPKAKQPRVVAEALSDVAKVRSYVGDRSPALKMLLEHLAVTLPKL